MHIGIIIHSQSGRTAEVARLLSAALTAGGHGVDTTLLRTVGKVAPGSKSFDLKSVPSVDEFDCLIIGGPVWAFSASPVAMKFIRSLGRLTGKKVLCYVTKGLPFVWTGGTRALHVMNESLALSDADILPGEILWTPMAVNREKIRPVIDRIASACTA